MRVIIIEDEKPAAEKLHKALFACDASLQVQAVLSSVKAAIEWLQQNAGPDLVFMDIELTDGLSFKIFEQVENKMRIDLVLQCFQFRLHPCTLQLFFLQLIAFRLLH